MSTTVAEHLQIGHELDFHEWENELEYREEVAGQLGQAVTAEAVQPTLTEFDWDLAEAQFSEPTDWERPPEKEIYGRSLSAVRSLGAFAMNHSLEETIRSPEAARAKAEFNTSVEEGFGTEINLGGGLEVRDFEERPVIGGLVMAKDLKTSISGMTKAGLACAQEKYTVERALGDERFLPQLIRSHWDNESAIIVNKMARGETDFNTYIFASPYHEGKAAENGDAYWRNIGYVPRLRRGFIWMYNVIAPGEVVLAGSLSFDGSDTRQLRQIFAEHDIHIPQDEITDNWSKYAITGNYSAKEARQLATQIADQAGDPRYKKNTNTVDVTARYHAVMDRAFNESYVHIAEPLVRGRQTANVDQLISQLASNAHHFNKRYRTALRKMRATPEQFTDDNAIVLHELLVYSTIEMMRGLHLSKARGGDGAQYDYLQAADTPVFQRSLSNYGADGAIHNRGYSACGLEIAAGEKDLDDILRQVLSDIDEFMDATLEEVLEAILGKGIEDEHGSLTFTCSQGHQNRRPYGRLIERCQRCGISVRC